MNETPMGVIVDAVAVGADGGRIRFDLPCDPGRLRETAAAHGPLAVVAAGEAHPNRLFGGWVKGRDPRELNLLAHAIGQSEDPVIVEKLEAVLDINQYQHDPHPALSLANLAVQSEGLPWYGYTWGGADRYERYGRTLAALRDMPDPVRALCDSVWSGCLDLREYGREAALDRDVILTPHGWLDLTDDMPDEGQYTADQLADILGLDADGD